MLLVLNRYCDIDELRGLIEAHTKASQLLCCADGVYLASHIQQQWPSLSCFALETDCASRGVIATQTLNHAEWMAMSIHHQQWVLL